MIEIIEISKLLISGFSKFSVENYIEEDISNKFKSRNNMIKNQCKIKKKVYQS